jgi:drug/metabolite transporter (DMT)-like permease
VSGAAVLVTLAAAVVHACWNQLLARSGDAHARTAVGMLIGAAVFLPVALVDVRLEPVAWVLAAASVGFELAYFALLATAYTRAPMGVVYPVARGSAPVIVLLAGLVLPGGSVSLLATAGILLVVLGIGLVYGVDGRARFGDVALAVTIGVSIAGYTLVDAAGVRHASAAAYIEVVFAVTAVLYAAFVARRAGARALRAVLDRRTAAIGVGVVAAYGLVLVALTLAPAAPVAALRETSVVFAMLLLMATGQERVTPARLGGAVVVSGGVAAVVLG